ncbi:MAG: prohibitin family protein [Myxococcota bacterium]|jgi:regulator of protease activity HflC (stomatin/prohibitin superfamily)
MITGRPSYSIRWMLVSVPVVLCLAALTLTSCTKIEAGHEGILYTMSGGTQNDIYPEGWHLRAPWNSMIEYSIRTQDKEETLHILTKNGLPIDLQASVRFRVIPNEVPQLHKNIGPDYYGVIIAPVVRSESRKIGGRYLAEEIYSTKREMVEKEIFDEITRAVSGRHILIEAILIRNVVLPEGIVKAISSKLEEEQNALRMKFTLQREEQEAERKRIEATGIRDFQRVVSEGISDKLLQWKGVEATELLSKSPNTKVVIIGSGKNGLPLILNQ